MNRSANEAHDEKRKDSRWSDLPDYQVDWLDYDYVTTCEDTSKLRDIYTVLQSGKEGRYPHLEQFVETRLLEILPAREKKLWVAQRTEPTFDDKSTAVSDLDSWASDVAKMDQTLTTRAKTEQATATNTRHAATKTAAPVDTGDIFGDVAPATSSTHTLTYSGSRGNVPPVRNQVKGSKKDKDKKDKKGKSSKENHDDGEDSDDDSNVSMIKEIDPTSEEAIRARNEKKRRYGFEYFKEWDKFDPDAELKRMEVCLNSHL